MAASNRWAWPSIPMDRSTPTTAAPRPTSHVTEQPDVGLIESFRTPDEAGRARLVATEEAPVLGKVCVGIAVPPPPVGRGRRGQPAVVGRRCRRIPCRARALPRWRPTGRGPAADLEHPTPSPVTAQPDVGLIESIRTPDEAGRARLVATEEAPVLGKVCVGIAVPPPPVGRGRRGRPDRPVADRAAVIRFVHVAHRRSPST